MPKKTSLEIFMSDNERDPSYFDIIFNFDKWLTTNLGRLSSQSHASSVHEIIKKWKYFQKEYILAFFLNKLPVLDLLLELEKFPKGDDLPKNKSSSK